MNAHKKSAALLILTMVVLIAMTAASEVIFIQPSHRRITGNTATTLDYMPEAARERTDTLVIGVPDLYGEINPFFAQTLGDQYAASLMFDELVFANAEGAFGTGVAAYTFDNETGVITFTIGEGVAYMDGEPVTSDDFINALYLLLTPGFDGAYTIGGAGIVGVDAYLAARSDSVDGIARVDSRTFTVRLAAKNPLDVAYFAIPALRVSVCGDMRRPEGTAPEACEAFYADALLRAREADVSAMAYGQYALSSVAVGEEAVLTRNTAYFRGAPNIENVSLLVVPPNGEVDAIMEGRVDIISVMGSVETVDRVFDQREGFINLYTWEGDALCYLGMNLASELFSDANVRKALAIGFDREGARMARIERYGKVPTSITFDVFEGEAQKELYAYDRERAEALLDAAGWLRGEDGIRVRGETRFEFTIYCNVGNPVLETIAPFLQADYAKLGLSVQMKTVPLDALIDMAEADACDMYVMTRRLPAAPGLAADLFVGDSHLNLGGFDDETASRDLERARASSDPTRQNVLYETLYMELYDELPFIPLYRRNELLLMNARVMNATVTATHEITSDVYRFFLVDTLEGQW